MREREFLKNPAPEFWDWNLLQTSVRNFACESWGKDHLQR
uniref:Uncharacterized protein n=1 Tax=Pseudomonas aeruginosa TaxID=287 RepID=A0A5P9WAQ0_PSEAI|nr:hypothetical protein pNK546KPC_0137 [Pseudomonas aeruginosa]QLG05595.1 hypothetical protein [Pseudomonas aeruginosa]